MKMSLMLKLSSIAILSSGLFASNEVQVLDFLKKNMAMNDGVSIKNISIKESQKLKDIPSWNAYFINLNLHVKSEKKDVNITDIVFSNGEYFAKDFVSFKSGRSIKSTLSPSADAKLYKASHLIAGDANAKHKLVVFSDPVCPFCMDFVPDAIEAAKKYPKTFALYYYHFPLQMHQSALGFSKAMLVAKKQGIKDVVLKTYEEGFDEKVGDDKAIAKVFSKALGVKVTQKQMNEKWVLEEIEKDMKIANELMVNGTPTLFIDGVKDAKRKEFVKILKSLKDKK